MYTILISSKYCMDTRYSVWNFYSWFYKIQTFDNNLKIPIAVFRNISLEFGGSNYYSQIPSETWFKEKTF